MENPWYALDLAVLRGVPADGRVGEGDLDLGEIGAGVYCQVIRDRGEDDDGAKEEQAEDGEERKEGATATHNGGEGEGEASKREWAK